MKETEQFMSFTKLVKELISQDRHRIELSVCLTVGILFGCVTQSVYGNGSVWYGLTEAYCSGWVPAFLSVAPVTLAFPVLLFVCAPFEGTRLLIYPSAAVRSMGLGSLICGAVQSGSLRELCFGTLVLLPYATVSCVVAVYAGEYALGFRTSMTGWNDGLTDRLCLHAIKMLLFYFVLSALSCAVFALSCVLFGRYLI